MSNYSIKSVLPGLPRHQEILYSLLPTESPYSKEKESLYTYCGLIFAFRHEDLCATHLATCLKLNEEYEKQDEASNKIRQKLHNLKAAMNEPPSSEELEMLEFTYVRQMQSLHTHDQYLDNIRSFADQHFIVGLWVVVEQSIAKLLKLYKDKTDKTFEIPHKWDQTIALFKTLNIVTDQTLPIYQNINELRVLNNKIKHLNEVDEQLARFSFFDSMLGKSIDRVRLDLQRYSDNSYAFVHFVAEQLIVE